MGRYMSGYMNGYMNTSALHCHLNDPTDVTSWTPTNVRDLRT
jgi:hypothetical protein